MSTTIKSKACPMNEPGKEIRAAQIIMGRGLVDVSRIEHEGRAGILFRPRTIHIPVGKQGELPPGEYWPVDGDVVVWVESEGGAQVIQTYLAPFLPLQPNVEAIRIADAVLSWLVKQGLADPYNEYRAEDVIDIMDDLAPSEAPEEPALIVSARQMVNDYQTSEQHHPNHVLVPLAAFEAMRAALTASGASAIRNMGGGDA